MSRAMAANKYEIVTTTVASIAVAAIGVGFFFNTRDTALLLFAGLAAAFIWGMFGLRLLVRGPLSGSLGPKLATVGSIGTRVIIILGIILYIQLRDPMIPVSAGLLLAAFWGSLFIARNAMQKRNRAA